MSARVLGGHLLDLPRVEASGFPKGDALHVFVPWKDSSSLLAKTQNTKLHPQRLVRRE